MACSAAPMQIAGLSGLVSSIAASHSFSQFVSSMAALHFCNTRTALQEDIGWVAIFGNGKERCWCLRPNPPLQRALIIHVRTPEPYQVFTVGWKRPSRQAYSPWSAHCYYLSLQRRPIGAYRTA